MSVSELFLLEVLPGNAHGGGSTWEVSQAERRVKFDGVRCFSTGLQDVSQCFAVGLVTSTQHMTIHVAVQIA